MKERLVWREGSEEWELLCQVLLFFPCAEISKKFPGKEIWNSGPLLRVYILFWEVVWERILMVDLLMKRGWQLANRCCLCRCREESTCHILINVLEG